MSFLVFGAHPFLLVFRFCCRVDWIDANLQAAFGGLFAVFCLCWLFIRTVDASSLKAGETDAKSLLQMLTKKEMYSRTLVLY